ncbi:platelet endothelial cell adhesion molecule isoform X5 [Choloepus didactylus]|uniref:platelet endothelial cell adhesion molecule isoform X5 n=1 Tax=Choloepus didactylus TaxID=27675 RepID=UPI00189E9EC2|nr:platelet endothelial cell adhesion molecule isoform X5 [Choloepus didactylus]
MQFQWPRGDKMWLGLLLILSFCSSLEGQENSFTINSIYMEILPSSTVHNGWNVTLQCIVDVSTTSHVKPQHLVLFYKDDVMFYNISSRENMESFFIPQARVYDSGKYRCTVIFNNKEKTTPEYEVSVKGVPSPRVMLDKKEVIEGGVVTVNCSVPEEKAPIFFKIEKFELSTKRVKQTREKNSKDQNFVTLEFPIEEQDLVLVFRCQARILSGFQLEMSEVVRSDLVTVRESFSTPKFHISPLGMITEGDDLHIKCTIQVTHLAQKFPEIIIQKDKVIVAHSRHGNEAVYSVMALGEHNGNYTCKVESSRISKVSSIVVNITELFSKPKLESSSTRLDQGEYLNLWCIVPGAPPANFTIQKGGLTMTQAQNFTKIASEWDSGTYTCTAAIGNVLKKSNAVHIAVCAPVDEVQLSIMLGEEVESGKPVVLQCTVKEGSPPISYSFYRANAGKPFYQVTSNYTQEIWHKEEASKEEEGQYYCKASNRANLGRRVPQSNILTVRVFLASWKKGLIAVAVIGVIIATLILGARCYFLRKAKSKQMPVEMSRPVAPLLSSNNEKMSSDPSAEANSHYGYNEDVGNHAMKLINENKEPLNSDVEYTEVEVSSPEPHQALGTKGTETVYSEIRKADPDFMENRYSRMEVSPDGT